MGSIVAGSLATDDRRWRAVVAGSLIFAGWCGGVLAVRAGKRRAAARPERFGHALGNPASLLAGRALRLAEATTVRLDGLENRVDANHGVLESVAEVYGLPGAGEVTGPLPALKLVDNEAG